MESANNIFSKIGVSALVVGAALAVSPMKADAATLWASSITAVNDTGLRGTADGRVQEGNALGNPDGRFFELGFDSVYDFQFGTTPGQSFFGPGSVVEVTFGNREAFPEAVKVQVGMNSDPSSFITATPNPVTNQSSSSSFTFSGAFDTVRLTDVTRTLSFFGSNTNDNGVEVGGFDVDAIGVSAVPLPAGGMLLLTAFGGLAVVRRRRKAA